MQEMFELVEKTDDSDETADTSDIDIGRDKPAEKNAVLLDKCQKLVKALQNRNGSSLGGGQGHNTNTGKDNPHASVKKQLKVWEGSGWYNGWSKSTSWQQAGSFGNGKGAKPGDKRKGKGGKSSKSKEGKGKSKGTAKVSKKRLAPWVR